MPMSCFSAEPTLADLFGDPIAHGLMGPPIVSITATFRCCAQRAQHLVAISVANRALNETSSIAVTGRRELFDPLFWLPRLYQTTITDDARPSTRLAY